MRSAGDSDRWAEIRRRIDAVGEALATGSGTREAAEILAERARDLARTGPTPQGEPHLEAVVFTAGGERYAIESRFVLEVTRSGAFARLPDAWPPTLGLTVWRGELLPLQDAAALTGGAAPPAPKPEWIIVVGDGRARFGIPVEPGVEVMTLAPSSFHPLPERTDAPRRHLLGVTPDGVLVVEGEDLLRTLMEGTTDDLDGE